MNAKAFFQKNKTVLIVILVLLIFGGIWAYVWARISKNIEQAGYDAALEELTFDGAYYTLCDLETVQLYLPEVKAADSSLCGTELGQLSVPTAQGLTTGTIYACKPLEDAQKRNALILLEREGTYSPYELTGFPYLDDDPSIWAVCASYGLAAGKDLASVTIADADGTYLAELKDEEELEQFFTAFVELGECLSEEQIASAYYAAYVREFGENGKIKLENGEIKAEDDAAYDQAMAFWSEGTRLVTIRLQNGLQLRDCLYLPNPGLFTVYGVYQFEEAFSLE